MSEFKKTIGLWIDSDSGISEGNPHSDQWTLVRILPFIAVHVLCILALFEPITSFAIAICIISYSIKMFSITGFYHRYFSHKTFKTNRFWQFIFATLGCSAVQRGPLWWAAHHRSHHINSDKKDDIHSPIQHGFWWSHMGWFTDPSSFETDYSKVKDWVKFPELVFLNRYFIFIPVLLGSATYIIGSYLGHHYPQLDTNGLHLFLWAFAIPTVLSWHATYTINSLCHKIGTQRYNTEDESKNHWFLAIITFGEGWHNNHHYNPGSARQGFYWWEIDITFYILKLLSYVGIIHSLRPVPKHAYADQPEILKGTS